MARFFVLIIFILVLQGVGAVIGLSFQPDGWYDALTKPPFNPPPQIFGVVWPILYLLIAIAGWRVFTSGGTVPGWGAWVVQMVTNWAWSPVFFGAHMIFWAMCLLGITLLATLAFIGITWGKSKLASLCMIPYVAWLSFAFLLNASIWILN